MQDYFEGNYYKHQKDGKTICFIIGMAKEGKFVQVITNEKVFYYDGWEGIQFSREGIKADLPEIKGEVKYGLLMPLGSNIMGPFRFFRMQCHHSVTSMYHKLEGGFIVEGEEICLTGGSGYIEGDRGTSFPKQYIWMQGNDFNTPCSIMISIADIPFCGIHFWGCICAIIYAGKEYRIATYKGARICYAGREKIILNQGDIWFEADIKGKEGLPLKAPHRGNMSKIIRESIAVEARCRLWKSGKLLFDLRDRNVSMESANLT